MWYNIWTAALIQTLSVGDISLAKPAVDLEATMCSAMHQKLDVNSKLEGRTSLSCHLHNNYHCYLQTFAFTTT